MNNKSLTLIINGSLFSKVLGQERRTGGFVDAILYAVMLVIGFIGAFFSGLLGIGGAIINYPLLLFVPPMFGLAAFSAQEVSAISMFQVFFASLAGIMTYRSKKETSSLIHKGLVLYMGVGILAGSLIGSFVSGYLPNDAINLIYGVLAALAVVLILIPSRGEPQEDGAKLKFNRLLAVACAFSVGIVSGIVGAGGAFILIPIMLTVLKIPTRTTIASSLAIVFISAVGGLIGKIAVVSFPVAVTIVTVIGSLIGSPIGAKVSAKANVRVLRLVLAVLIAVMAVKIWMSIIG